MQEVKVVQRSGMPIGLILTLIFVVLKLTDNIDWSWWWVLSPIWISIVIFGSLFIIGLFLISWLEYRKTKKRMKLFEKEAKNIHIP